MEDLKEILPEEISSSESAELNEVWQAMPYIKDDVERTSFMFSQLQTRIKQNRQRKITRIVASVSSVAALLFLSFLLINKNEDVAPSVHFDYKELGVAAPTSKVTLQVGKNITAINSSGAVVSFNDSTNSKLNVATESGKKITEVSGSDILTIKVPVGHQFETMLSDGTKVWLNSDSQISYPASFTGDTRKVMIVGEAFFDVAHNANKPFIVSVAGKYDVKVLGTTFNVDSYPGEEYSRTTLVTGKIKVILPGQNNEVDLEPSHQLTLDNHKCLDVSVVNTESFTSWREKRFVFDSESLATIAQKMQRCYGMEIFVGEKYRHITFSGRISYNKGIDYFIKILKETEGINCEFKQGMLLIGVKK